MRICFVDDDEQVRWTTQKVLESLGHEVTAYASAEEAMAIIECGACGCECFLLDRNMPGMSGIEMLEVIKSTPSLENTPVILLTSSDQPEEIAEGLAAGAQLYLAKPAPKRLLNAALAQIERGLRERREINNYMQEAKGAMALASQIKFELKTVQDARQVSALLASLTDEPDRTSLGFVELIINGIEHGNLGISYEEKSKLLEDNLLEEEINLRLSKPEFAAKKVVVNVTRTLDKGLQVDIEDDGAGFNWEPYMDFCPHRAFDLHGRGIAISNKMAFDQLSYLGKGNRVQVRILPRDQFQNTHANNAHEALI